VFHNAVLLSSRITERTPLFAQTGTVVGLQPASGAAFDPRKAVRDCAAEVALAPSECTTISIEMAEYGVGKRISHSSAELRVADKCRRSLFRREAVAKTTIV